MSNGSDKEDESNSKQEKRLLYLPYVRGFSIHVDAFASMSETHIQIKAHVGTSVDVSRKKNRDLMKSSKLQFIKSRGGV